MDGPSTSQPPAESNRPLREGHRRGPAIYVWKTECEAATAPDDLIARLSKRNQRGIVRRLGAFVNLATRTCIPSQNDTTSLAPENMAALLPRELFDLEQVAEKTQPAGRMN